MSPVTSKELILAVCRQIVSENGLPALNMREVARRCGVALGSIYNYFPSKDDIMIAAIDSVWHDIFHMRECGSLSCFTDYVSDMIENIESGKKHYPNFFTSHTMSLAEDGAGKPSQIMPKYFEHMQSGLLKVLNNDSRVRPDAFTEAFTQADFAEFVLSNIIGHLTKSFQPDILVEMIIRAIY